MLGVRAKQKLLRQQELTIMTAQGGTEHESWEAHPTDEVNLKGH